MDYTRIYRGMDGKSHFANVSADLSPTDFAPPAPPINLAAPIEAERTVFCQFPAGWVGDWHPSPHRQFYFQMSGELEVQVGDGEVRRLSAGSVVLLEDTSGKGHVTRVVGASGVEAVFVQLPSTSNTPSSGSE